MPASHGLPGDLVQFRAPLFVLLALVGVVLLIACANLAGLSLGRAPARRREMVTRASIGASRPRLIRQMLAESLLIAMVGGVLSIPCWMCRGSGWRQLVGRRCKGFPGALTHKICCAIASRSVRCESVAGGIPGPTTKSAGTCAFAEAETIPSQQFRESVSFSRFDFVSPMHRPAFRFGIQAIAVPSLRRSG
jgi:hypothetical protein